jgi:D-glycero-alpha-D-manno-heptose-7-phosphate kinase
MEQLELLLCARISGAGGGGFMIFLADPMQRIRLAEELRRFEESGTVYGCHFTNVGARVNRTATKD